jgi:hypothetical protein
MHIYLIIEGLKGRPFVSLILIDHWKDKMIGPLGLSDNLGSATWADGPGLANEWPFGPNETDINFPES